MNVIDLSVILNNEELELLKKCFENEILHRKDVPILDSEEILN
jgi:hypothetical protein